MPSQHPPGSPRRAELLDACYGYVLAHGLAGLSLLPLAAATGTSSRVLLYLFGFGSKENLVREVLAHAARARAKRHRWTIVVAAQATSMVHPCRFRQGAGAGPGRPRRGLAGRVRPAGYPGRAGRGPRAAGRRCR